MAEKPNAAGAKDKRKHRASYAKDKRKGGYLVRVEGPHSNSFAGTEVPVSLRDGTEQKEKLDVLIWTGKDKETLQPVSLYSFVVKPKEVIQPEF